MISKPNCIVFVTQYQTAGIQESIQIAQVRNDTPILKSTENFNGSCNILGVCFMAKVIQRFQ